MKPFPMLACLLGLSFLSVLSLAQVAVALPEPEGRSSLFVGVRLEPELTTSLGYTCTLNPLNKRTQIRVGGGLTVLPLLLGSGNWRIHLTGAADWRPAQHWGATFSALFYLAQVHHQAGRMDGLGVEARVTPSHYGSHWTTGLDLGWQSTLLTHIKHGEATKETFRNRYPGQVDYTGPVDGWYVATAHRFRVGLVGARRLFSRTALQISAGSIFSLQKQGVALSFAHAQFPVYAEVLLRAEW